MLFDDRPAGVDKDIAVTLKILEDETLTAKEASTELLVEGDTDLSSEFDVVWC